MGTLGLGREWDVGSGLWGGDTGMGTPGWGAWGREHGNRGFVGGVEVGLSCSPVVSGLGTPGAPRPRVAICHRWDPAGPWERQAPPRHLHTQRPLHHVTVQTTPLQTMPHSFRPRPFRPRPLSFRPRPQSSDHTPFKPRPFRPRPPSDHAPFRPRPPCRAPRGEPCAPPSIELSETPGTPNPPHGRHPWDPL